MKQIQTFKWLHLRKLLKIFLVKQIKIRSTERLRDHKRYIGESKSASSEISERK